jgi:DivIVA domain-containing protein
VPLTPAEIHNAEFAKASLGKRGYAEEQVDALLDEVTREMIRLLEENAQLQRHLHSPAAPAAPTDVELAAATAALDRAQLARDQAVREADQAQDLLNEARQSVTSVTASVSPAGLPPYLAMAQRTADNCLHESDEQSTTLLAEARQQAERLVDDAHQQVNDIEETVRRHQTEAAAELAAKRTAAEHQIDELTQFAEGYQAALEDQIARQGHLIDGPPA